MVLTLPVSDELVRRLGEPDEVSRRALEAFGLAEYVAGRLSDPELQQLLGFETRHQLDGFLQAHQVCDGTTVDDVLRDVETLKRIRR